MFGIPLHYVVEVYAMVNTKDIANELEPYRTFSILYQKEFKINIFS